MTMPNPQASTPQYEVIGDYTVHPAASLFPLLDDDDAIFEDLKCSIEDHGQQVPILVQGNVLLDGRNRLRACLQLGIKPVVKEYTGPLLPSQLISDLNLSRRDLEPDMRTMIVTRLFAMLQAERELAAQKAAGKQYGKGRPKVVQDSAQPMRAPATRDQIAAKAKVSRHKAEQALKVAKDAPDLAEQVQKGRMSLATAAKKTRPSRPRVEPSFLDTKTRLLSKVRRVLTLYPSHRSELKSALLELF